MSERIEVQGKFWCQRWYLYTRIRWLSLSAFSLKKTIHVFGFNNLLDMVVMGTYASACDKCLPFNIPARVLST